MSYAAFCNVALDSSVKELLSAFMRSGLSAVLEPFLGQTVIWGNSNSSRGRVAIELEIGLSCQSDKDLPMRIPAPTKPKQTIRNQTHFSSLV